MFVCCKACGKACDGLSKSCTEACKCICPRDKPAPIYSVFAAISNGLAVLFCFIAIIDGDDGCKDNNSTWLFICLPLGILNILFAFYIRHKFMKLREEGKSICDGGIKLAMYDVGVYFYFWVFCFGFVWAIVGMAWVPGSGSDCNSRGPGTLAVIMLAVFYFGAFFVAICSSCIEWSRGGSRAPANQQPLASNQYQQDGQQQQAQQPQYSDPSKGYSQGQPQQQPPAYPQQQGGYPQQQQAYPQQGGYPPPQQGYNQSPYPNAQTPPPAFAPH